MKKILIFLLLIAVTIGGAGCMGNKAKKYKDDILTYLEQKYHEKFEIDNLRLERNIGDPEVVRATCHSEKYPHELFTVLYHQSITEIYEEEEIIKILKEADCYDEDKMQKWESDIEPYFEDDYSNVKYQNLFDQSLETPEYIRLKTRFKTTNYYPTASESIVPLEEYYDTENYDLYSYHYIFINEETAVESEIESVVNNIVSDRINGQYILIYYIKSSSFSDVVNDYFKNYDSANDYFDSAPYVSEKAIKVFHYGIQK